MYLRNETLIWAALLVLLIPLLKSRRYQRIKRLEKQTEDENNKARKNAKIEQYLKIVDARGQVNKRKMIERWLQHVEAERKSSTQIPEPPSNITKIIKQPVRRSARLNLKRQLAEQTS